MTDPIADMIIRLKNAGASRKDSVSFPYSKLKESICVVLEREGFIGAFEKKGKNIAKTIQVELLYPNDNPRIEGVRRVSKPSRRLYVGSKEIRRVKNGFGMLILSTPNGIKTGEEARKEKVGGETMFEIW